MSSVEVLSTPRDSGFVTQWYDYARPGHFWFDWRLRAALGQVRSLGLPLDEPLRALEIGAGPGVLRDAWEQATAWTVDITDLNPEALRRARPGRGRTMYYDVTDRRPELVGQYQAVFLFDVIEHIPDTLPFLRAAVDHLAPGGHLLVNVPAGPYLHSVYDDVVGHLRRYVPDTLAAEVRAADLTVDDVRYWGFAAVPLLLMRKAVLRRVTTDDVVRTGFEPPMAFANALLLALGRAETTLVPRPPRGSSLLLAARRTR